MESNIEYLAGAPFASEVIEHPLFIFWNIWLTEQGNNVCARHEKCWLLPVNLIRPYITPSGGWENPKTLNCFGCRQA